MWHEARRQEKQLRAKIADGSKRAERRRKFYDSVRKDPDQFMQIHGSKCTIHAERSIARQAEDVNILRPWAGDKDVLIDRFDARSHLDVVEPGDGAPELTTMERKEELICNFERYRLLVMNEFKDIPEKNALKNITDKEYWLTGQMEDKRKQELERRRKTTESKATFGFTYGDSHTVKGGDEEDDSSAEEDLQTEELDADLEVYLLNPESQKRCNKIGDSYGVVEQHFCALFKADQQAQRTAAEIKRIDRQKAALVGREAKGDRRLLKQERAILIANAKQEEALVTLSSFQNKAKDEKPQSESSSSSSDEESKPQFILSFGKNDEEPLSSKSKTRRTTRDSKRSRNRSRSRSKTRSRSSRSSSYDRDRNRRRKRSRSRERRTWSRSRSRERRRSRDRRSRSRNVKRSRKSRSRSRDKRKRKNKQISNSSKSRSRSRDRPLFKPKPAEVPKFQEALVERESSDDDGPITLLEIRSSMSESEKERIEIENRKRRVRRTKRMVKNKSENTSRARRQRTPEKTDHAQVMKKKMKKALKATVEELKEEEEEKKREVEREKRVREELIYIEQQERKMREQKKVDEARKADVDRAIQDARSRAVSLKEKPSGDSDGDSRRY